jgi:ribosomal protein L11 methyltransferase
MNYIELTFTVSPKELGSDVLIAELADLAFDTFTDSENGFSAYVKEEDYSKEAVAQIVAQYSEQFNIAFEEKQIAQQNWNAEWENNFQPIDIDGRCYIRAPFHASKDNYQYDIIIEPKMSFGTGHHSTTQLMIQSLLDLDVKNKTILDMGCGTGVLAIVASKMGAADITAIDIDEWSYENTIENASVNSASAIKTLKGDATLLKNTLPFDIVLANINKNILLSDMAAYVNVLSAGGQLLLSGFFETDTDELKAHANQLGLHFNKQATDSTWAMLHFIN